MTGISLGRKILALILFLAIIPTIYWVYTTVNKNTTPSNPKTSSSGSSSAQTSQPLGFIEGKVDSLGESEIVVNGKSYQYGLPLTYGRYKVNPSILSDLSKRQEIVAKRPEKISKEDIQVGDYVSLVVVDDLSKIPEASKKGVVQIVLFKE